ncbi:MAG: S8 family serine peptidase [Gemmatimonadetes bacterium]|uniref:S8 family serine peptidase n=1 Tax=Candidatus Kutchimonas denitrificans TaxID=3056748 RepID=A0AAE4Z8V2_9BACT|nr:S8 family serine peptidase [Gemmatimonadota bacterium]NIR75803.1 S8 family serine peptidase [Candidatus Kutchimonas denitrificans]NIS01971.1 S8 family serine peptidase [Gemmatimonadota bacterium]NIT67775.1 S8 family serine peptidase [Gemmatimonadota bacterium]NIU53762.1 S8 family serine peptidase [Gemmatimonadota bacterium]
MRIPLLVLVALAAIGIARAEAQELTPEDVRTLLEFNLSDTASFVPGVIIVKMRQNQELSANQLQPYGLESAARQLSGGEYIYRIPSSQMQVMGATQARDATLSAVEAMRERDDVEYAQPNYILRILDREPSDPRFTEQWHYRNNGTGPGESPGGIGLPTVWETNRGSRDVVVSILDTGILPDHPDIVGSANLIAGYDMISDPGTGNDGDGRDDDPTDPGDACAPQPDSWHGTHVAGTVGVGRTDNAEGVAGVNWEVSVQPVRVLGVCGGTIADINDAIRWAAGLTVPGVPDNPTPARVINMSLGASGSCSVSPSTQAAIDDAFDAGAAVVVAAGNEASDAANFFPASCDNVITVAASDYRGRLVNRYSNFGATVEIMAPGGDLNRDDDGDGNPDGVLSMVQGGYAYYNGTSMATPHVAGVLALWLAEDPTLTPDQMLAELEAAALPRSATECPRPCGAGLLNAVGGTVVDTTLRITLRLDPDEKLRNGETTTAIATVRRGGTPASGLTVAFASEDTDVATVSPAAAVTDGDGVARSTVTGVSRGDANITATVDGVTASQPVEVPDLATIGIVALALLMIVTAMLRRRRRRAALRA